MNDFVVTTTVFFGRGFGLGFAAWAAWWPQGERERSRQDGDALRTVAGVGGQARARVGSLIGPIVRDRR